MAQRLDLQALLVSLLGSSYVYFQPPPTVKMQYPCIVYKLDKVDTRFAGNKPYSKEKRYQVTVIDANPDSEVPDKISDLPKCAFERFFTSENHNHNVYNLYF